MMEEELTVYQIRFLIGGPSGSQNVLSVKTLSFWSLFCLSSLCSTLLLFQYNEAKVQHVSGQVNENTIYNSLDTILFYCHISENVCFKGSLFIPRL